MAHNFASAIAVHAESRPRTLARFADPFPIATSAIYLAVYTVRTRNSLAFIGRVSIHGIGNRHTLIANAVEDVGDSFIDGGSEVFGLSLKEWLFLFLRPVGDIAAPTTGGATYLCATLAFGTYIPAATRAGFTKSMTGAITAGTGNHIIQPFETCATGGRF